MRVALDWDRDAGIIACMTDFRGEQGATGAQESGKSRQGRLDECGMPIAKRVPTKRVFHGDTFIDECEWLRDRNRRMCRITSPHRTGIANSAWKR